MANQYKNKVVYGNETLLDLSNDTVTDPSHILAGHTGHLANGRQVAGTGGAGIRTIYSGNTVPASSLGQNGDIYFVTVTEASVERYPESYGSSRLNSTSGLEKCIGVSAEDGTSTSNVYSSGNNTTGTADYSFDLSDSPSDATSVSVSCDVKAHEENASRSTCTLQLYSGSTAKGSVTTVNGTSNAIYSLNCGSWTRSELDNLILRLSVGYYGGLIAGATLSITYTIDAQWFGALVGKNGNVSMTGDTLYSKTNGSWSKVESVALDEKIVIPV